MPIKNKFLKIILMELLILADTFSFFMGHPLHFANLIKHSR